MVSECTYISSNGYEFCFDMRPDAYPVEALGLVCPRWVEDLTADMKEWVAGRAAGKAFCMPTPTNATRRMAVTCECGLEQALNCSAGPSVAASSSMQHQTPFEIHRGFSSLQLETLLLNVACCPTCYVLRQTSACSTALTHGQESGTIICPCCPTPGLSPDDLLSGFGTRIWLQLKPECDTQGLLNEVEALDPFMLLNLRKLR